MSAEPTPRRTTSHYGDAVFLGESLRLLDLIPRRLPILILWSLAAAAVVVGLEALYSWMQARVTVGGAPVAVLDLNAKESLADWLSTLTLLAAGVAALLIYSIRRHRIDDYQGRYRMWLWAAVCWLLTATDHATNLHTAFQQLMVGLTGSRLVGDGSVWWISCYALLLVAVGSRLMLDMRPNWPAILLLALAGISGGLAVAMSLGWSWPQTEEQEIMVRVGATMAGSALVLVAMGFHARHVLLDAEGLLPDKSHDVADQDAIVGQGLADKTSTGGSAAGSQRSNNSWRKIDPPHSTPAPASHRTPPTPVTSAVAAAVPAASALAPVQRKLTKAERKALKERLLRERMQRMQ